MSTRLSTSPGKVVAALRALEVVAAVVVVELVVVVAHWHWELWEAKGERVEVVEGLELMSMGRGSHSRCYYYYYCCCRR